MYAEWALLKARIKMCRIGLLVSIVCLLFIEWIYIRYQAFSTHGKQYSYFDVCYQLTSEWPYLIIMVGSLLCAFVCLVVTRMDINVQLIYRYKHKRGFWWSLCLFTGITAFIMSACFTFGSRIFSLLYEEAVCNWKNPNSYMNDYITSLSISTENLIEPTYIKLMLITFVCCFFSFWVMALLSLFGWYIFQQPILGILAIVIINMLDQLGIRIFYSWNKADYAFWIAPNFLRFAVPVLWIVAIILIGCIYSQKKEFYEEKKSD